MLVVFLPIFVADTKTTFVYNFVAPLSNSFFNFFMKMKNEKRETKGIKNSKKNLLNMKMVVNYLNFVFLNEVKSKSKYRILDFVFQFIKNTKLGYTD